MKTALFHADGEIQLHDRPTPAVSPGRVALEVRSAGICGSDLHYVHGKNPWGSPSVWPRQLGHELAGVIVEVGAGVRDFHVGDRVVVEPMHLAACGACDTCRAGHGHVCPSRGLVDGVRWSSAGFSEIDVALASHVHALPDGLSFDDGALADVYACGVHAIHRVSDRAWRRVVIVGSGAVAFCLGQLLRAWGAECVMLVTRRAQVAEQARAAGAADVTLVSTLPEELGASVRELTGGAGADLVFETVGGNGTALELALAAAAPRAAIVVLGAFWDDLRLRYALANRKEIDLRFSNSYGAWNEIREISIAIDELAKGRVQSAPLITHHLSLARIQDAFQAAIDKRRSGAVKVMVHPTGPGATP